MCSMWSKWQRIDQGDVLQGYDRLTGRLLDESEKGVIGKYEAQRRECEKCGMSQLRETRS